MKRRLIKIAKITGLVILILVIVLYSLILAFSKPATTDKIMEEFAENEAEVYIDELIFRDFEFRVLTTQKEIDSSKVNLVFVHGSIGSANDFKNYLMDKDLNERFNMLAYDRIGYGIHHTGDVQESIAFERDMMESLLNSLDSENTILVGYSYGGPIVLASQKKYKKIVLFAPAVYSEVEPMPWAINFYKFKGTRCLMPKIWKAASREKLSHATDLKRFENNWHKNPSEVVSIHGDEDWIVPMENSFYLAKKFGEERFELVTLKAAGHGLVWSRFQEIKAVLLNQLND